MAGAAVVGGPVLPSNVIPTSYKVTHDTDGLPGFPAFDWFRPAGTIVGSPLSGTVLYTKPAGGGNSKVYGMHVRIRGDRGQDVFLTHFGDVFVRAGSKVREGDPLGRVAPYGKASHIHVSMKSSAGIGSTVDLRSGTGTGGGGGSFVGGVVSAPDRFGDWVRGGIVGGADAAGDAVNDAVRGAIGGAVEAALPGLRRTGLVVGGFVLALVGLLVIARQLGAPAPVPQVAARFVRR